MTMLDRILVTADQLTEPQIHTSEPITTWDGNRNKKIRRHQVVLPGLLAQLHQSVIPVSSSGQPPAGGVPGSRPPLAAEALSRHAEISTEAAKWCTNLGIPQRPTVESNIRALVGALGHLDRDQLSTLHKDMRRWRNTCAVYLGWERLFRPRGIPCPVVDCGEIDTLLVNLTTATALCQACGSVWDDTDGSIRVLAEHISRKAERSAAV